MTAFWNAVLIQNHLNLYIFLSLYYPQRLNPFGSWFLQVFSLISVSESWDVMWRDWTLTIGIKWFPGNYCLSYSLKYFAKPITTGRKSIAKRLSEDFLFFDPSSCRLERVPGHVWTCVHVCAIVVFVLFSVEVALPCTKSDIPALLKWFSFPFISVRLKFSFLKWKRNFWEVQRQLTHILWPE